MKHLLYIMVGMIAVSSVAGAQEIRAPYKDLPKTFFQAPNPEDAVWKEISAIAVKLLPQNMTAPGLQVASVGELQTRAIHNGKWLAVWVSWADATRDVNVDTGMATDACAIQFPVGASDKTPPFMGAKGAPVAISHWKAIWQNDVAGKYQDVQDLHPNFWTDMYFFAEGQRPYPVTTSFNSTAARNTLGAVYVNNPIAQLHRKLPVEEAMAEGFGTLTTQPQQDTIGGGSYKDGRWSVVFMRKMSNGDSHDPKLKVGQNTAIAFAVWDGGQKNVGGRKNYAPWVPITLERKP